MSRFLKAGRFIINIDAIAKIEDLTSGVGHAEINVHLNNGDYLVLREADARAVLDFFLSQTKGTHGHSTAHSSLEYGDVPSCTRM